MHVYSHYFPTKPSGVVARFASAILGGSKASARIGQAGHFLDTLRNGDSVANVSASA
jgi:hypothetical protein